MNSLEEDLDVTNGRIVELEKEVAIIRENILILSDATKDMQKFIYKMAQNQAVITKRIAQWPFVAVEQQRGYPEEE